MVCHSTRTNRGFTLVELLVALMAMALLGVMSWRGIDTMARSRNQTQLRSDEVLALQNSLAQWSADLDALAAMPAPAPAASTLPRTLEWSAQSLRLTRYSASSAATPGLRVVAWNRRDVQGVPRWLRWQSDEVRTAAGLQNAWEQAGAWAVNPGAAARRAEVAAAPLLDWQIYFYRGDAWSHPSSGSAGQADPDGVRLVLTLPPDSALPGAITRDWIRPTVGGNKS
jgi:general secretion pathway protein J